MRILTSLDRIDKIFKGQEKGVLWMNARGDNRVATLKETDYVVSILLFLFL